LTEPVTRSAVSGQAALGVAAGRSGSSGIDPAFGGPGWARYTDCELHAVCNSVSKARTVVMFECPRVEHRRERCGFGHIRPN